MDEDLRHTFEDDEEEEEVKAPRIPFFQTLLGKIVLFSVAFIAIIFISIIIANIIFSIRIGNMEKEEEIESEDKLTLIKNPKTFAIGSMNYNLEEPGTILSADIYLEYDSDNQNLRWELDNRSDQIISTVRYIIESNSKKNIDSQYERDNILKPKILKAINDMLINGKLHAVYFKEFTIFTTPIQ